MAKRYREGKIKMVSEKVSRKMVLEIKYVNAKTRIVHMIELVSYGYVNKGWKRKNVHLQNERFSSVQVKVHVSK